MESNQAVQTFRAITVDDGISEREILKFLKWGNDDMEKALNYYYRRKEKSGEGYNSSREENQSTSVFDKMKKASKKQQKKDQYIQNIKQIYELPVGASKNNQSTGGVVTRNQSKKQSISNSACSDKEQYNQVENNEEKDDCSQHHPSQMDQEPVNQFQDADYTPHAFYHPERRPGKVSVKMDVEKEQEYQPRKPIRALEKPKKQAILSKPTRKAHYIPIIKETQQQNIHKNLQESQRAVTQNPKATQQSSDSKRQTDNCFNQKLKESELYSGHYLLKCVATQSRQMSSCPPGTAIQMQIYMDAPSKKSKNNFKKKQSPNMNIRVAFKGGLILGRVDDKEARVLVPLISGKLIRVQATMFDRPSFMSFPKNFTLLVKVYLLKRAISDKPYVQTFQGESDQILKMYKDVREQLIGLLFRLDLKIVTEPLIKGKSQFSKSGAHVKRGDRSCSLGQNGKTEYQCEMSMIQKREKQAAQQYRQRNDPTFKQVQRSITQAFSVSSKQCTSSNQKRQVKEKQPEKIQEGGIQKRIIEISNTQADSRFAQLIDLYHQDLEPYTPSPEVFQSQLYPYQALALAWMLRREGHNGAIPNSQNDSNQQEQDIHPLWTEYQLPLQNSQQPQYKSKYRLFFNQLTAQISLRRPVSKIKCRGGILADEMGLGKTVMMSALIATSRFEKKSPLQVRSSAVKQVTNSKVGMNLIVLPLTLLHQWECQLKKHAKGLKILQYYSTERHRSVNSLQNYDVVLTTYGTISHEFSKGCHVTKTSLYRYKWKRIILDEAHYIKGRIIQTAKAVYQLQGDNRWCLTGTPIQNNLTDLFSLIHFIRYTPWADYECWNRYIEKPYQNGQQGVLEILRTLLKKVFLRRTKNSKDQHGNLIVSLPQRVSKVQILKLSAKQRKFYDSVYQSEKKRIDELFEMNVLEAKYMQVLQILMRLRQICCHPALFKSVTKFIKDPKDFQNQLRKFIKKREVQREKVLIAESPDSLKGNEFDQNDQNYYEPIIEQNSSEVRAVRVNQNFDSFRNSEEFLKETVSKIVNNELQACRICLNQMESPVITVCLHMFCKACILRQVEENGSCGFCRRRLVGKQDFLHLPRQNRLNIDMSSIADSEGENSSNAFYRSTKMKALMNHLESFESDDKVVVFSQFLGMLDLIENDLKLHKITFVRMEGSHSHKQRTKAISTFNDNPEVKVFIVSLRTAGVGLNLTAANKVFLMDPWWNPGVEQQAIERVHRVGQKRKVQIFRFIMEETIEMRMLELNISKRNLSQAVIGKEKESGQGKEGKSKMETLKYLLEKY